MTAGGIVGVERWLGVPEVAHRLSVTPETVRVWIHSGRLPASQPNGRHWRVRESVLVSFAESRSGVFGG